MSDFSNGPAPGARQGNLRLSTIPTLLFAVEGASLIAAIALVGFGTTVLLLVAGALLGGLLLRRTGVWAAAELGRRGAGVDAAAILAHGATRAIAGVLLILPGFASDFLAIALLIPQLRALILRRAAAMVGAPAPGPRGPGVIEGSFTRVDEAGDRDPWAGSGPRRVVGPRDPC